MLFAKSKEAQRQFSDLFTQRKIQKTYLALSIHRPSKKMGLIKGDLEKGRGGSYRLLRTSTNPSLTSFKSFFLSESKLRVFILTPTTGQTHQLRVHLKSIGSPILGDTRYGSDQSDRMYLACIGLKFKFQEEEFEFKFLPTVGEQFNKKELDSLLSAEI